MILENPPIGNEEFLYELPEDFGGSLKDSDLKERNNGLMAFDIKTGMNDAQKAFEKKEEEKLKKAEELAAKAEQKDEKEKTDVKVEDQVVKPPLALNEKAASPSPGRKSTVLGGKKLIIKNFKALDKKKSSVGVAQLKPLEMQKAKSYH